MTTSPACTPQASCFVCEVFKNGRLMTHVFRLRNLTSEQRPELIWSHAEAAAADDAGGALGDVTDLREHGGGDGVLVAALDLAQ
jgi:hypothetical protein